MDSVVLVAAILVVAKALMMVVGTAFLLSGLDDAFIDACYAVRSVYRRLFVLPRIARLSERQLVQKAEQPIAIMIPAWDESAVIRPMLLNTLRTLAYGNYQIFVGTYPNDAATHREVDAVCRQHARVQRITCPHDGPTNKADCLNWIYQGIRLFERQHGVRFEIFVMQDCEDVIHPLCYRVFNYLIPRKDMVQLPVLSLPRKWYQFTAGHYIDEFSQLHYKDLVVREMLNRSLPAAGVGCAFSRRAFEIVAEHNHNQVFSIDSLTEDYDFGFRMSRHGLKQVFVRLMIERTVERPPGPAGWMRPRRRQELVCIREYFPASYGAAVRQKSRWVVGITLQGWRNLGWMGNGWMRYMLFRDRKSLVTNLVNMLGYLLVLIVAAVWLALWLDPEGYRYPPLLERDTWLWHVVVANAVLFGVRLFQRAYCVQRLYGWTQAALSVPRMVWGNFINFMATARAIRLYARFLRTGRLIAWDKTTHSYPSEEELLGSGGVAAKQGAGAIAPAPST